ncbi:MAG TPA: NAD+ synthase, partial [Chlamydiales bacterium]|nr:NAD+ synthase [Chlamydiales bacterium]
IEGNTRKILAALERAKKNGADVALFSELSITGYPPEDLLLDLSMVDAAEKKLREIAPATKGLFVAVGVPRRNPRKKEKPLCNSAAIFIDGELVGFKDKVLLPTYDVFDERRYFEPGKEQTVFEYLGRRIGVTICEDAWQHAGRVGFSDYMRDPVAEYAEAGIDLLLNLSASPYYYKREDLRLSVFSACARTLRCPVIFCNQVGVNDQIVFDGHSFYMNEKGEFIQIARGFAEDDLLIDLSLHVCGWANPQNGISDLYAALVLGVRDYFEKQGFTKAILGLSGGIDSALVACIAKEALGADNVSALALPSRFSSPESYADAAQLSANLGISLQTISIDDLYQQYLHLVESYFVGCKPDITEENLQSRIRGQILMAFSNKFSSLLLNTGNKSEMAMGYTTLYGDMAGGLGVLHDVTKLNVYQLARFVNAQREIIPSSILHKAPTAELRPNQKDSDTLPPFELLDPVLEDYIEEHLTAQEIAARRGIPLEFVQEIIRKIHAAEYKRRQAPIGIRVTHKAFSKGRNIPIVQKWK